VDPSAHVAIATDDPGWHGERLQAAFAVRGVQTSFVSLRECRIDLEHSRHGIVIPGFEQRLPDGVFVRQVPGGTLEQVVLRLDILHALKALSVPVYNDGRAIERTVDKAMTSFLLSRAGVATPPTWVVESQSQAHAIVRRQTAAGGEVVIKPLFGSRGAGLRRVRSVGELPSGEEGAGVYYLQCFIEPGPEGYRDWRVFVIAGRAVAAMQRRGRDWINNVALGAACEAVEATGPLARIAESACRAVDVDYGGVDIMRGRDGVTQVVEVNGIPAWRGLQSVCGFDLAQRLVDDFLLRHLDRPVPRSTAPA
jgi:tetrahydromethanopterin:alpha-L-glutamate ligase